MFQSNKNISKWLIRLLKLVIALLALWFIYQKVMLRENLADWWSTTESQLRHPQNLPVLISVVLLMLLNWSIEAIKWQFMIRKIERLGFFRSFEAVLSGVTVSFFTPNRTGEFAGRVFHLKTADRIEATIITLLENFSQLLITVFMGVVCAALLTITGSVMPELVHPGYVIAVAILVLAGLYGYFNIAKLDNWYRRLRLPEKGYHYIHVLALYPKAELLVLLLLSVFRYFVFCTQFYLLLGIFNVDVPPHLAYPYIAMIYLVMAVIPSFTLTEIGVRGAVSTLFFSLLTSNTPGILNASFALWLINLVLPALAGAVFILSFRLNRKRQ